MEHEDLCCLALDLCFWVASRRKFAKRIGNYNRGTKDSHTAKVIWNCCCGKCLKQ